MDYDKTTIAQGYDAARGFEGDEMQLWLDLFQVHRPELVGALLDLGCGTGRFTATLADFFGAPVAGVDPSETMLAKAQAKNSHRQDLSFQQSSGEVLPFGDDSFDLVFLSMVFHHLEDPAACGRECGRVLRQGGRVFLRNGSRDLAETYPFHGIFPGVEKVLHERLTWRSEMVEAFSAGGLTVIHHQEVPQVMAPNLASFTDKMALRADSIIAALPDADYETGMARLRAQTPSADPAEAVTVMVEFLVFG